MSDQANSTKIRFADKIEIIKIFEKHNFTDPNGNRLTDCVDFHDLIQRSFAREVTLDSTMVVTPTYLLPDDENVLTVYCRNLHSDSFRACFGIPIHREKLRADKYHEPFEFRLEEDFFHKYPMSSSRQ